MKIHHQCRLKLCSNKSAVLVSLLQCPALGEKNHKSCRAMSGTTRNGSLRIGCMWPGGTVAASWSHKPESKARFIPEWGKFIRNQWERRATAWYKQPGRLQFSHRVWKSYIQQGYFGWTQRHWWSLCANDNTERPNCRICHDKIHSNGETHPDSGQQTPLPDTFSAASRPIITLLC